MDEIPTQFDLLIHYGLCQCTWSKPTRQDISWEGATILELNIVNICEERDSDIPWHFQNSMNYILRVI